MGQIIPGREDALDKVYIVGTHDSRKERRNIERYTQMGHMILGREDAIDKVYIDGTHDSRKGRRNRYSIHRWDK